MGNALIVVQGYAAPAVGEAFHQARLLCQKLNDTTQLFSVLHGLHRFCYVHGEWQLARELGEQMVSLAERNSDPILRPEANRALGVTLWLQGEFTLAQNHFEQGSTWYDRQHYARYLRLSGQDPGVVCLGGGALTLWCLGYAEQAYQGIEQTLALAQAVANPFVLTYAHFYDCLVYQFEAEPAAVGQGAEIIMALARQHEFTYYLGVGMVLRGWAQTQQGQHAVGIASMQQGMTTIHETGALLFRHYYLGLLADAYRQVGELEEALQIIREALRAVPSSGRFWEADLYRLHGELLLLKPTSDPEVASAEAAEMSFHQAIAIAQRQNAKALELRATISLWQLWQRQGRQIEAQKMLTPIYEWFNADFDSADLKVARALLAVLSAPHHNINLQ
ncbi:hypothetical protein BH10CHL1_BH10CHL1_39430 [soil metagenome]